VLTKFSKKPPVLHYALKRSLKVLLSSFFYVKKSPIAKWHGHQSDDELSQGEGDLERDAHSRFRPLAHQLHGQDVARQKSAHSACFT